MLSSDDVLRMARESGVLLTTPGGVAIWCPDEIERFAALVAAAEREACAKVCDELKAHEHTGDGDRYWLAAFDCAANIRGRAFVLK